MIRVLVVDDEKIVRKGIVALLPWGSFDMKVAGEAENYEKALEFLQSNTVDLLFTDLTMPGKSGIDLIKEVRSRYPSMGIVVLTCHQDFNYIQEVLRLGAVDYIVKTQLELEPVEEILGRIAARIKNDRISGRQPELHHTRSALLDSRYSEEVNESIRNALDYIENNLTRRISQDEAAKTANMSKGYFSHCFKEVVGKLFVEYVKELKMKKAKELLLDSNRPVYWIAEQLGFQDEKYFSRIFREYTGLLPTELRSMRDRNEL